MHTAFQQITIDGTTYGYDDMTGSGGQKSRMQLLFREKYGEDSFQASLADFVADWFSGGDRLKVHTSGSTGKPKELWVEKERMVNSAQMTIDFLGLKRGDTALLCMPLPYIAGKMVVVRAIVAGLNLIPVTPCGHPLKDLSVSPAFAAMIPMQVFNSLKDEGEKEKLQAIGNLIIGGGAIDSAMAEELKAFPNKVWSTYGMTETLSHIALRPLSGKDSSDWYTPFNNVHLGLSADNTLVIDAPSVSPVRLETNDIVEFNKEGLFHILGRRDNTINTGGIKVQIEQVEEKLKSALSSPFMITSLPDRKFGEKIVLLTAATDVSGIEEAFSILPSYWRPKEIITVDHLPLTGTGKPDRAKAKEMARNRK